MLQTIHVQRLKGFNMTDVRARFPSCQTTENHGTWIPTPAIELPLESDYDHQNIDREINNDPAVRVLRATYPEDLDESLCYLLLVHIVAYPVGRL